jgi:hypothetical protein
MASSPWGSWVAVEACAPGTVRVFRGVPASTADGPTAYAPITDRHGSELTLDARPETIPGEPMSEAHVLAMAIVPLDKEDKEEERSERGATVVVMTEQELRVFAIRRGDSGPGKEYFECAASASGRLSYDTFLGRDRGRLVGVAADDANVAVVASRVARVLFRVNRFDVRPEEVMHDCSLPNGQTLKGVFRAEPRDGPVVACAFIDSGTRTAQIPSDPGTVNCAMGFAKEIRLVRFVGEGYEVLRRVLVDAPGPVRSIAVYGGWLFASTERETALPTFRDGSPFAREPVNFAFQNAARFAGERTKAGMSETAILIGDDGRDAEVETPFLRARLDPAEKTKRLQDMVQPFLPAELRGSLPPAEVSEGSEGVKEAERRDPRATLQAFALENLRNAFEDEDDEEDAFVAARLSLPLAPTARRPEICALQSRHEGRDGRKSGYVVALTDVGASTGASVAVAELVRGSRRDFRLVARGTASLQTRSDAKTETETKPRVEAFGRIARFSGAQKGGAGAKAFGLDVALLTSETNDSETANADAGFRIFGGGSTKKKKPAPPASLATIRVSLDVTRRSRAVDDAPTARAPSEGVPTTPSSSRARRTNEGEALHPPEAPRVEPPELSDPRSRATDFERVLAAIRALDGAVHDRFDRVEATLQIQERRLRRVEESLLKK